MTYKDIACIGSAVSSVRYCQTPEVDKHRLSANPAGARLLVTHEAMYTIICHRRAVVWLQVLSALHFDPTDLTSLKTILCCLSQPHAETRTTQPKQAATRFVVFSAPSEVFVSLTWHAFVLRRAWCPSNSSQVFNVFIQYVLIICDMHKAYRPIPVAARSEAWVCGFSVLGSRVRIPPVVWMSVVIVVCYQVQISKTGRSLVQRNPIECGVWVWSRNLGNEALAHWGYRVI